MKKKFIVLLVILIIVLSILLAFGSPMITAKGDYREKPNMSQPNIPNLVDNRNYKIQYYDGYSTYGLEQTRGIQTYLDWNGDYQSVKERKIKYYDYSNETHIKYVADCGRFKLQFENFSNTIITSKFSFKQRPSEIGLYNWNTETYINKENITKASNIIPNYQEKSLRYNDVFTNTDILFISNESHIKELFINDASVFWPYPNGWNPNDTYLVIFTRLFDFEGIKLYDNDGEINQSKVINGILQLKSTEIGEEILAYLPIGKAYSNFSDEQIHYTDVKNRIVFRNNEVYYVSAIDYRFVRHIERIGNLYIDPTWTIGEDGDAWNECEFYQTMENQTTHYAQLYPNNSSGYIISPIEKAQQNWIRIKYEGILNDGAIDIYWNGSMNEEDWIFDLVKINAKPNINYYLPNPSKFGKWMFIWHGSSSPFKTPEIYNITVYNDPPNANYFSYYKEITINASQVSGLSPHIDFPFMINISDSDLQTSAQEDGDDIAFANDTSWLDHEIEKWNGSISNHLVAWIRIPSLNPLINTTIYMYYGNDTIASQQNPQGVWDDNYRHVYHLIEDPESPATIYDSTQYNKDGTTYNMESEDQKYGQIDGSLEFDGTNQEFVSIPYTNLGNSLTYSFWFKLNSISGYGEKPIAFMSTVLLYDPPYTRIKWYPDIYASKTEVSYTFDTDWHYFVVSQFDTTCSIFVDNNQLADNVTASSISTTNTNNYFGRDFDGYIDEMRISNVSRDDDWIITKYNNQFNPSSFYSIGEEQEVEEEPPIEPPIIYADMNSVIISAVFLGILMILMIILYTKLRIWLIIATIFFFSLIIGFMALSVENPFTPYYQFLFMLFQGIIFLLASFDAFKKKRSD